MSSDQLYNELEGQLTSHIDRYGSPKSVLINPRDYQIIVSESPMFLTLANEPYTKWYGVELKKSREVPQGSLKFD